MHEMNGSPVMKRMAVFAPEILIDQSERLFFRNERSFQHFL